MNISSSNSLMSIVTFSTALLVSPYAVAVNKVALVRTDCANYTNQTCFTTMADANTWIVGQNPSATSPVLIDVGPGQFDKFTCSDSGWITLRGSGKNNTEISRGNAGGGPAGNYGVSLKNCRNVTIQDLTVSNGNNALKINNALGTGNNLVFQNIDIKTPANTPANTISWFGDGSSTWLNVEVSGAGESGRWVWHDTCDGAERPQHYWFGSKLTSSSSGLYNVTFESECADSWFYGSEIAAFAVGGNNLRNEAVELTFEAKLRVFGSVLRSVVAAGVSQFGGFPIRTVKLTGNSEFHMHGGIINADASQGGSVNRDAIGVAIGDNVDPTPSASAHIVDTSFTVKPKGSGQKIRIQSGTSSPYQWPASVSPPANLVSLTGADTFVETDCYANGDCNTVGGTETHLMIYNLACTTAGNWFDSTTGRCRGVVK